MLGICPDDSPSRTKESQELARAGHAIESKYCIKRTIPKREMIIGRRHNSGESVPIDLSEHLLGRIAKNNLEETQRQ
jgi:hypothetical protein